MKARVRISENTFVGRDIQSCSNWMITSKLNNYQIQRDHFPPLIHKPPLVFSRIGQTEPITSSNQIKTLQTIQHSQIAFLDPETMSTSKTVRKLQVLSPVPADIDIANSVEPVHISEIAKDLNLSPNHYDLYGKYKAKVCIYLSVYFALKILFLLISLMTRNWVFTHSYASLSTLWFDDGLGT